MVLSETGYLTPEDRLLKVRQIMDEVPQGFSPVISLAIIDGKTAPNNRISGESLILCGVRDPEANPVHPNVISSITRRQPPSLIADALLQYSTVRTDFEDGNVIVTYGLTGRPSDYRLGFDNHAPMAEEYMVEGIFARKLGMAEYLVDGRLIVESRITNGVYGLVYGGCRKEPKKYEPTLMVGIIVFVEIDSGVNFPKTTSSYSKLEWVTVTDFQELAHKNPGVIDKIFGEGSMLELCVTGLCVVSADNTTRTLMNN